MSYLTKCIDGRCPSRAKCERYTAKAVPLQGYADFGRAQDDDKCADGFIENFPSADFKPASPAAP